MTDNNRPMPVDLYFKGIPIENADDAQRQKERYCDRCIYQIKSIQASTGIRDWCDLGHKPDIVGGCSYLRLVPGR